MTAVEPMTAPAAVDAPIIGTAPVSAVEPAPADRGSAAHTHSNRCYWDFRECGWVCGSHH